MKCWWIYNVLCLLIAITWRHLFCSYHIVCCSILFHSALFWFSILFHFVQICILFRSLLFSILFTSIRVSSVHPIPLFSVLCHLFCSMHLIMPSILFGSVLSQFVLHPCGWQKSEIGSCIYLMFPTYCRQMIRSGHVSGWRVPLPGVCEQTCEHEARVMPIVVLLNVGVKWKQLLSHTSGSRNNKPVNISLSSLIFVFDEALLVAQVALLCTLAVPHKHMMRTNEALRWQ